MNYNLNLIMKRTVIRRTLTVFAFAFSSQFIFVENALGQNLKENNINYVAKDATINNVFKQLNKLTGFYFFYNESVLKDLRTVNIQIQKGSIEDILKSLSQQTGLYFKRINNTISVSKTPEPESNNSTQQRKRLTGVITDSNGETIIGANISVKGSTLGTITDVNGNFSLEVPNSGMLTISYIGYISKNVPITNENNISITLTEDTQKLDEVVVVGYGVVRKSDLTGSVGSVKANIIESMPIARVDQALQGRVSGVQITTSNGAPGASTTIRIRGGNSINAGNEPLYVIDGIIGGGDLNTINPADIESIEVLKDASSTAIYGSRGANGVILITTKRGNGSEGVKVSYVNANTAEQIKGKYAEITDMLRLNGMYADICKYNGIKYEHPLFICADSTLNKFFHYTTLEGSLSTVLTTPDKIAISETFARKLFHGHSGIGEMIEIIDADGKTQKYEVGAILKERPQSFLHFDLLTGITGEFWGGPTLLKLHPGASASLLQEKIRKDKIPTLTPGSTQYYVDALKNLYFNTKKNSKQQELPYFQQSDVPLLYIGLISALLVLAIACFNYTNLSLSRTLQQIKMIHIEKLMGAQLKEIRRQLFYDATLTVLLSFFFSLLLINDLLPWFNYCRRIYPFLSFSAGKSCHCF